MCYGLGTTLASNPLNASAGSTKETIVSKVSPIAANNPDPAVSISGPDTRMPVPLMDSSMAIKVFETAGHISQALGYLDEPA